MGFNAVRRARDSTTRRFSYEFRGTETFDLSRPISEIITDDNIGAEDSADGAADTEWLEFIEYTSSSIALSDFSVAGNAAFILSTIDLSETDGNQTSSERPLQGQSPWVLNLQILYEHEQTGTGLSLLYNAFGPRISEVGQSGIPDTYDLPIHRLDLTGSQRIAPAWSLKVKATNLLDWPARERTGTEIAEEVYEGWSAGIGIGWSPPV